jgi:hypothetical protein
MKTRARLSGTEVDNIVVLNRPISEPQGCKDYKQ